MAKIKLKNCLILPRSEQDETNIYLDTLDYRDKGNIANVPDEAIIYYIKCGGDRMYNRKTWESSFKIISFEDPKLEKEHEYLLQSSPPKTDYAETKYDGLGKGRVSFLKDIKEKISPEQILELDLEDAIDELTKKYNLADISFLKQVGKELETYRDEVLEEIVGDMIKDIEEKRNEIEYTEDFLMKKGPKFLQSLANDLKIKSASKMKSKKQMVEGIITANESLQNRRKRTQLLKK